MEKHIKKHQSAKKYPVSSEQEIMYTLQELSIRREMPLTREWMMRLKMEKIFR